MKNNLLIGVIGHRNSGKSRTWNDLFEMKVKTGSHIRRLNLTDTEYIEVFLVSGSPEERELYVGDIIGDQKPRIVLCSMQYIENVFSTINYFGENDYLVLVLRYKELFNSNGDGGASTDIPFEIEGYLTEIDTGKIDADFMNSRFNKYLKKLGNKDVDAQELQMTLDELHKSFASLTQEEQKFANIFIHDVQSGTAKLENGKSFREYVTEYQFNAKNSQIRKLVVVLGIDESKLRALIDVEVSKVNINDYGRFDDLKNTVDKKKAKEYFETVSGSSIPAFKVNIRVHNLLQQFIVDGGFEI